MTVAREYLRVSVDKSGRERSPEEQHQDNQRAAERHGWTLGKPYKDIGSASRYATKQRQDFDRLLADLEKGNFNAQVLILWESSRGSRKVSEWLRLIEACEARSVQIYVTADNKTYDPSNPRDRRTLLEDAVDGEYESSKVSKRAKRAQAANAAAGRPSGRVPYGYMRRYHPVTRALVAQEPEPSEAAVVTELFDRIVKGHSLLSIETDFEQRGIRTRSGIVFTAQHLRDLALKHCYAGIRVHDPDRHKVKTKLSPTAEFIPAAWKPLVTRETFLAVQRILTAPERITTRPGRGVHLLSMIGLCGACGGPLAARTNPDRSETQQYICHRSGHVRISYDDLNAYVEAVMLRWMARPSNVAWLQPAEGDEQIQAARDEVASVQAELDDLADRLGRGELSATLAARAEPGILKRLKQAQDQERSLSTPDTLQGLIEPGKDVAKRWESTPMEAKRQIARILLQRGFIGELRVSRSSSQGHRRPVKDRVTFVREDTPQLA